MTKARIKTSKKTTNEKLIKERLITVPMSFSLCDWSDSLSYDQINDTLFLIGNYINNPATHKDMKEEDKRYIESWLERNDIEKFLNAKDEALEHQAIEVEKQLFFQDIVNTSYKKRLSH